MTHPTTAYAEAVLAGDVVTGQPVRWACERHMADLERGSLTFDEVAADRAFRFFEQLYHFEGQWQTARLRLEPWQHFTLGSIFGWRRQDGTRRFRTAWVEVARKNGKSFLWSGAGLFLLLMDGEPGAQVWTAATKRDQARIIHRGAINIRDKTPSLRGLVKKVRDRLYVTETASFFAPLGADSKTEDGLNPHGVLIDEIHAHRNGEMWDVLISALAARRQPLFAAVTTAGFGRHTFGHQQHEYFRAIADPASGIEADSAFVYIASLDKDDDPYEEGVWAKANPNLGVSVSLDYMRQQAEEAKQHPRAENNFLCKNLNVWTEQAVRWLSMDAWDACDEEVAA